ASSLEGDNRFLPRNAARQSSEPAWISERFEVQKNHRRPRIALPILKKVVAGNIRLVADADEAGKTESSLRRERKNRHPKRAALGRERNAALRRDDRRERRVQADGWIGIQQAHAVRADHSQPKLTDLLDEALLQDSTGAPRLGETRGDDGERFDSCG